MLPVTRTVNSRVQLKHSSLIPFFIAFAMFFSSCEDDVVVNERESVIEAQFSEPTSDESTAESIKESIDFGTENRDAVLVILRGYLDPGATIPFRFEVSRVVSAELFRDVDRIKVPNRFITQAQILDENGLVLWDENVDSLFQVLEFLKLVISEQSPIALDVGQVYRFVDMQYPELLEFGMLVPSSIVDAKIFRLAVPDEDGTLVEALKVPIADLIKEAAPSRFEPRAKTLVNNGKPADKIDVVVIADGYQADNEDKFDADARAVEKRFFETEPFKSYANDFNFHTVFIPSAENGAGYDCTGNAARDMNCKEDIRDTAFATTFVVSAVADKFGFDIDRSSTRVAMPLNIAKLYEVASSVPFDQIILLSNSERSSGFAGLYFSVVTAYDDRIDFPDTAVHELGHSYGLLGDEYSNTNDPCFSNEPKVSLPVNIASTVSPLKWKALVDEGAPIPTPDTLANSVSVGAFEGAYSCEGHFRPSATCKMRNSDHEFCAVCSQQLVNRIGTGIDAISSDGLKINRTKDGISITASDIQNRQLQFFLADVLISSKDGVAQISESQLGPEWKELKVVAEFTSQFVKVPTAQSKVEKSIWLRFLP